MPFSRPRSGSAGGSAVAVSAVTTRGDNRAEVGDRPADHDDRSAASAASAARGTACAPWRSAFGIRDAWTEESKKRCVGTSRSTAVRKPAMNARVDSSLYRQRDPPVRNGLIDPSDGVISAVGNVHISVCVDSHPGRTRQLGFSGRAYIARVSVDASPGEYRNLIPNGNIQRLICCESATVMALCENLVFSRREMPGNNLRSKSNETR